MKATAQIRRAIATLEATQPGTLRDRARQAVWKELELLEDQYDIYIATTDDLRSQVNMWFQKNRETEKRYAELKATLTGAS